MGFMLDRCINQFANQTGNEMYGKSLLKVTSQAVENCDKLKTAFFAACHYIRDHLKVNKALFQEEELDTLFIWWQKKILHCRVVQVISSHYAMLAQKSGKMSKGATTTRDELYQIARKQSKSQKTI